MDDFGGPLEPELDSEGDFTGFIKGERPQVNDSPLGPMTMLASHEVGQPLEMEPPLIFPKDPVSDRDEPVLELYQGLDGGHPEDDFHQVSFLTEDGRGHTVPLVVANLWAGYRVAQEALEEHEKE